MVETLAGNGTKGSDYKGGGKGTTQAWRAFIQFSETCLFAFFRWNWCMCYEMSICLYGVVHSIIMIENQFYVAKSWDKWPFEMKFLLIFQLLNSPWDVCFEPENEIVYIAMAGQHQIWEHNTLDGVTKAFSGDGYERNLNGSR